MIRTQLVGVVLVILCLAAGTAMGTDVFLAISGPGAVNDSTIKAGEKVSVDIYWANDTDDLRGFTTGFKISSADIKTIVHVADSGKGINTQGDIKGHNGWENTAVWDFAGVWPVMTNWDGALPDQIGFGGLVIKNHYGKHEKQKVLSWEIIVPDAGALTIDSAFFPPGGIWAVALAGGVEAKPTWHGPYKYQVVK